MSDTLTLHIVKATFVVLLLASALTWAIVVVKAIQRNRLAGQARSFINAFGRTAGLPGLDDVQKHQGPLARLATVAIKSWRESGERTSGGTAELDVRRDLLERDLRQQLQRERRGVEAGLPVLASIGSMSPFVGLFGTVLGIIHALQRISLSSSASLDVVAGPIGEALVATAVGIAVAVPAVLAYNYFLRGLKSFVADLEEFANELVSAAIKSTLGSSRRAEHSVNRPISLRQEASA